MLHTGIPSPFMSHWVSPDRPRNHASFLFLHSAPGCGIASGVYQFPETLQPQMLSMYRRLEGWVCVCLNPADIGHMASLTSTAGQAIFLLEVPAGFSIHLLLLYTDGLFPCYCCILDHFPGGTLQLQRDVPPSKPGWGSSSREHNSIPALLQPHGVEGMWVCIPNPPLTNWTVWTSACLGVLAVSCHINLFSERMFTGHTRSTQELPLSSTELTNPIPTM